MTTEEDPYANVPHMRVLECLTCKTLEELPDYEGRPEDDVTLTYAVDKHGTSHEGKLYRLPIGLWLDENYRKRIIEQIRGGSKGLAEFDSSFYDVNNTFREDAQKCFQKHLRPKEGCPEFRKDHKALRPDTKVERKEAGLAPISTGPKVWLCDFCPVRSYYAAKVNKSI